MRQDVGAGRVCGCVGVCDVLARRMTPGQLFSLTVLPTLSVGVSREFQCRPCGGNFSGHADI